jgi:lactoylglutathione lyase
MLGVVHTANVESARFRLTAMARYLHTMLRITDPARSRAFYDALGMEFRREAPIVRNEEKEATLYFFGFPGQEEELELTLNHDGRSYELGTAYGHIAIGVDDLQATLDELAKQDIMPEREPYRVREGGSLLCFVQDPDS